MTAGKVVKTEKRGIIMENNLIVNDVAQVNLVEQLQQPSNSFYCSIKDDGTRKSKVAIYNAVNNAEESLNDHIGEVLEIVNVVAFPVDLLDEETGEMIQALQTVLVAKDGKTYKATSQGITNSIVRIFSIVGKPDNGAWEKEPIKIKVKQVKTRNGNNKVNIIELV